MRAPERVDVPIMEKDNEERTMCDEKMIGCNTKIFLHVRSRFLHKVVVVCILLLLFASQLCS